MVFRKENKVDAFQRQISALRQQLGGPGGEIEDEETGYATGDDRYGDAPDDRYADGTARESPYPAQDEDPSPYRGTEAGGAIRSDLPAVMDPPPVPIPVADAQTSVIAHDTVWKGDLDSQGTIHVHGRLEGSLKAKLDIYVAEEADVDATIAATNVVVAGLVRGTIRCATRFEVLPTGRVMGDVQATNMVDHDGATESGQLRMGAPETTESRPHSPVQRRAARSGS